MVWANGVMKWCGPKGCAVVWPKDVGAVVALMVPTINSYFCEVSDPRHRGTVTSLAGFWGSLGLLLCYLLGCFVRWYTAAWIIPLVTIVPSFLGLMVALESPSWLLRKGRKAEAVTNLHRLRSSSEVAKKELADIEKSLTKNTNSFFQSLKLLKKRDKFIPILISIFMFVTREFSGIAAIAIYIVNFFKIAGVGLNPFWSSVVVGSARMAGNFLGAVLLRHLSRRYLLVGGGCLSSAALAALGTFYFLQDKGHDLSQLNWLPLMSFVFYALGITVGITPASYLVVLEIIPGPVRALGLGIATTTYALSAFLVVKTVNDAQTVLGSCGLFWSYSAGCAIIVLFVLIFVPKPRKRSPEDIEN
nr:facilitated trehalose transporter Tret1-2 homolog [Procambarus clarkii]